MYLMRKGMRLQTPFFVVVFLPKYSSFARFAVVISNKLLAKAPLRARVKRRLRAMIPQVFNKLASPSQYDCIFLAKPNVLTASWSDLVAAGEKMFSTMHNVASRSGNTPLSKDSIS